MFNLEELNKQFNESLSVIMKKTAELDKISEDIVTLEKELKNLRLSIPDEGIFVFCSSDSRGNHYLGLNKSADSKNRISYKCIYGGNKIMDIDELILKPFIDTKWDVRYEFFKYIPLLIKEIENKCINTMGFSIKEDNFDEVDEKILKGR